MQAPQARLRTKAALRIDRPQWRRVAPVGVEPARGAQRGSSRGQVPNEISFLFPNRRWRR
eukprot:361689-Chlamydomonas_euryale.AAC.18